MVELAIDHVAEATIVGRGGFSAVYSARHTLLQRAVAVKVLNPLTDDSGRRSFERECQVMGQMAEHPNVIAVYHAGFDRNEQPYIIMELVSGGTLADHLRRRGPIPWKEAIGFVKPIGEALGAAHALQILHRDVKPENVLLDDDGVPKLADFGIAQLRNAAGATSTHITASWLHTAPETFDNKRDERSDLYSLASTLYELVTGHAPFWRADDESLSPLMMRLVNEPPPTIGPGVGPPALDAFFVSALAKDPDRRPQSAAAMTAQLDQLVTTGLLPDASASASTPPPASPPAAPVSPWWTEAPPPAVPLNRQGPAPISQPAVVTPNQAITRSAVAFVPPQPAGWSGRSGTGPAAPPGAPPPAGTGAGRSSRRPLLVAAAAAAVAVLGLAVVAVSRAPSDGDSPDEAAGPLIPQESIEPGAACEGARVVELGEIETGTSSFVNLNAPICYRWTFPGREGQLIIGRGFANDGEDVVLGLESSNGEVLLLQDENLGGQFQEQFASGQRFSSDDEYGITLLARTGDGGTGGVFWDIREPEPGAAGSPDADADAGATLGVSEGANPDSPGCDGIEVTDEGDIAPGQTAAVALEPEGVCYRWVYNGLDGQPIVAQARATSGEDLVLVLENSRGEILLREDDNRAGPDQERFDRGLRYEGDDEYRIILLSRGGGGGTGQLFFDVNE